MSHLFQIVWNVTTSKEHIKSHPVKMGHSEIQWVAIIPLWVCVFILLSLHEVLNERGQG